jgi:hypothetical protein
MKFSHIFENLLAFLGRAAAVEVVGVLRGVILVSSHFSGKTIASASTASSSVATAKIGKI